jgi:hypothetical protein
VTTASTFNALLLELFNYVQNKHTRNSELCWLDVTASEVSTAVKIDMGYKTYKAVATNPQHSIRDFSSNSMPVILDTRAAAKGDDF